MTRSTVLIAALEADLIGPYKKLGGLDVSDELLRLPPSPALRKR